MAAPVLTSLIAPLIENQPQMVLAIISVFAAFVVVSVVSLAVYMVLNAVRGRKMIGGQFWDKDVYASAMQELHSQKRRGVLLDAEANNALKDYQGMGKRRSGRF